LAPCISTLTRFHLLGKNLFACRRSTCQVATRPGKAGHELRADRVSGVDHDDGQTGSAVARRADGGRAKGKDQRHRERLEFGGERALALRARAGPTDFDRQVLSFDPAQFAQARTQGREVDPASGGRPVVRSKQPDPGDLAGRLGANRERFEQVRAGDDDQEGPPVHD
jgi:hypothetical protein